MPVTTFIEEVDPWFGFRVRLRRAGQAPDISRADGWHDRVIRVVPPGSERRMKWGFLGLGGVFILMIWMFAKEFHQSVAHGLIEDRIGFARLNAVSTLIVLAAAVLAVLVCVLGYTVHVRLDAIETQLGTPLSVASDR
jgi:hypothetical protein